VTDYDAAWTDAILQRTGDFFDIGCNVGSVTLTALRTNPSRRVVAVDANPDALAEAAAGCIRAGFSHQVRDQLGFVSDVEGEELEFWTVGTGAAGSRYRSHAGTAATKDSHFVVSTTTIDSLCRRFDITPHFVKVDVEGAEKEALHGAIEVASTGATFLVEMHSSPELSMFDNASAVLGWCETTRYAAWYLKLHSRLDSPATIEHRGRCHLLLQPVSDPFPDYLAEIEQGQPIGAPSRV
jgi:FkbM family methyltransferase